jgi:hypothetical protein
MASTKQIRFSKPWGLYNAGEVATIDAKQADHLVKYGSAVHEADHLEEVDANAKADAKKRAADKKAAPARTKKAASEAKKKAAEAKKAATE